MNIILFFTIILVVTELFEAVMQRASTLMGILEKLNVYYQKSIFLFFLLQPSLYIIFLVILITGVMNIGIIFLLILKISDIFYKITLINKVFRDKDISPTLRESLEWKMPSWFFLMNIGIYPPLLFYSLSAIN